MRYESLIFDIDGTLWDSRALVAEGYNIQLEREGLSQLAVNADMFIPLFGKVMTEIADIIFPSIPVPERYALMERCMDTENKHLQSNPCHIGYPGIRETMEKLAESHRLFIVSNSQKGYPELCIEKLGLTDLIQGPVPANAQSQQNRRAGEIVRPLRAGCRLHHHPSKAN